MLITFESKILKAAVKKVSKGLMRSLSTQKRHVNYEPLLSPEE